jgi:hypothetical protein
MNPDKAFINLKALSLELNSLTVESDAHVASLKNLCDNALKEIDLLKTDSLSAYVIMTKVQAKEYIHKAKVEIEKYNNKIIQRSDGNFVDVIKPVQAGLEIILNLEY